MSTAPDREAIAAAVFALLQGATFWGAGQVQKIGGHTTWVSSSRRLKLWGDVDVSRQPAMFLVEHDEDYRWGGQGKMNLRTMVLSVFCYASTASQTVVGGQLLNWMLTGIERALAPTGPDITEGQLTLGRMVNSCRIEGRVFKDPGDIDNQALLVVPIRVLWP